MTKSNQPVIHTPNLSFSNPSLQSEMQAFDNLPEILRQTLREAPIDMSAIQCLNEYLQNPKNMNNLAQEIKDYLFKVLNEDRKSKGLTEIEVRYTPNESIIFTITEQGKQFLEQLLEKEI